MLITYNNLSNIYSLIELLLEEIYSIAILY